MRVSFAGTDEILLLSKNASKDLAAIFWIPLQIPAILKSNHSYLCYLVYTEYLSNLSNFKILNLL